MPRDGTGQYNLPTLTNPPVNGGVISAAEEVATRADLAAALTGSLARDGQGGMTGALNMGGYPIFGMNAPATRTALAAAAQFNTNFGTVGETRALNSGSGSALVAPAGGTWWCWWIGVTVSTGTLIGTPENAVVAGGTTLKAGTGGVAFWGFAVRAA